MNITKLNSQPPLNHLHPNHKRTRVRIARPHGVHLDVRPPGGQELLVDEGPPAADGARVVGQVLGRAVVDLAEEALDAAALRVGVVDPDVVVLARGGLLDEGLFGVVVREGGWGGGVGWLGRWLGR